MVLLIWILLIIACLCLIIKNNMLLFFIALELIVLAINLNFIFFSINNEILKDLCCIIIVSISSNRYCNWIIVVIKIFRNTLKGDIKLSALIFLKG